MISWRLHRRLTALTSACHLPTDAVQEWKSRAAAPTDRGAWMRSVPMDAETTAAVQTSYDRVAEEYAAHFFDELAAKPLDRALLDCLAEQVRELGPIVDIGCGPGQIARYLHDRGVAAMGIDLSPQMVALAQRLSPDIPFQQGTMLALDAEDSSWGGITAFYSIIHVPPDDIPRALTEFHRVLRPGGLLLLAFHAG